MVTFGEYVYLYPTHESLLMQIEIILFIKNIIFLSLDKNRFLK